MSSDEETNQAIAEVASQVNDVHNFLADLSEHVAKLEAYITYKPDEPNDSLRSWIEDWLIPTFTLSGALRGWDTKPAVISELTALFRGYLAMTDPKASLWDALTWHGHLASTLDRIEQHNRRGSNPAAQLNLGGLA